MQNISNKLFLLLGLGLFFNYVGVAAVELKSSKEETEKKEATVNKEELDKLNERFFFDAVKKGNIEAVRELLGKVDINIQADGVTALMYAAIHGNQQITALLLQNGADSNIRQSDGYAALICAAMYGQNGEDAFMQAKAEEIKDLIQKYTAYYLEYGNAYILYRIKYRNGFADSLFTNLHSAGMPKDFIPLVEGYCQMMSFLEFIDYHEAQKSSEESKKKHEKEQKE